MLLFNALAACEHLASQAKEGHRQWPMGLTSSRLILSLFWGVNMMRLSLLPQQIEKIEILGDVGWCKVSMHDLVERAHNWWLLVNGLHTLEADRVAAGEGHRWFRTNTEAAETDLAEVHGRFWHFEVQVLVIIGCLDTIWRRILKLNILPFLFSVVDFMKVTLGMINGVQAAFRLWFLLFFNLYLSQTLSLFTFQIIYLNIDLREAKPPQLTGTWTVLPS
jgi:hypothetical protein